MKAAFVMPCYDERRAVIEAELKRRAAALDAEAIMPEDLLEEVTALTEWPVIYESQFESEFLAVPQECLILTMQLNQKYFALEDRSGKLMNRFLLVSQLIAKDGGKAISEGNARVVRARLADAKFFYDQDRMHTLESRVEGLRHVVYHNKLGSQYERMLRVRRIAAAAAALLGANKTEADRAAMLAKADLRTLMVGEFPELQGIMGEYYAENDKESKDVALAIREHYQPRYAGDALPSTSVSLAVALADKLETLIGLFGIGQLPTGEKDPFALRRHALGVLRMLIEKELDVSLPALIDAAWEAERMLPASSIIDRNCSRSSPIVCASCFVSAAPRHRKLMLFLQSGLTSSPTFRSASAPCVPLWICRKQRRLRLPTSASVISSRKLRVR